MAISVQLRRLEQRVGSPLFVRGRRSINLLPAGKRLAPPPATLFTAMERLAAQVADLGASSVPVRR